MSERKSEHIDIRLPPGVLAKLRAHAEKIHIPPAVWVRSLVLAELEKAATTTTAKAAE
jgi:hypothetical protein